jgi:hypothetical protein
MRSTESSDLLSTWPSLLQDFFSFGYFTNYLNLKRATFEAYAGIAQELVDIELLNEENAQSQHNGRPSQSPG